MKTDNIMKDIVFLAFLTFLVMLSANANACRNQVPESEAIRYHESAKLGEGVAPLYTCKDKPNEACLCFDHCEGWDVCEVKEVEVTPDEGEPYKEKRLVNNLEKLQAKRAAKDVEENHKEIAKAKRKEAKERLRGIDWEKNMNASDLKKILRDLYFERQSEQ